VLGCLISVLHFIPSVVGNIALVLSLSIMLSGEEKRYFFAIWLINSEQPRIDISWGLYESRYSSADMLLHPNQEKNSCISGKFSFVS